MNKCDFVGYSDFGEKLIMLLFEHKDTFSKYFLELFKLAKSNSRPE